MDYGTMPPEKWMMPIMDDAASKQLRSNLQPRASNLCFFPISFRFTLLCKNASANHLESHSCENKGLKTPWNHTLTKKVGGRGALPHQPPWLHPASRVNLRPCLTGLLRLSTMPVSSMNVCGSIGPTLGPAATRWAAMFMGPKTSGL